MKVPVRLVSHDFSMLHSPGGSPPDAEFAKAKPAIERAFALNHNLAEAQAVLGIFARRYDEAAPAPPAATRHEEVSIPDQTDGPVVVKAQLIMATPVGA